ncbi:MAG: CDGSH iron-sulfur domain-containing protein [Coriobacteriia bacterium]
MRFTHAEALEKPAAGVLPAGMYHWCRCGKTQTPPYCDGSHVGSGITPLDFESDGMSQVEVCTCGLTLNPPYCDGSHVEY